MLLTDYGAERCLRQMAQSVAEWFSVVAQLLLSTRHYRLRFSLALKSGVNDDTAIVAQWENGFAEDRCVR